MITKVEVFSAQPDAPALPLGGFFANTDPVQVRNIDGLGPVKADILSTPFATGDGELFQGSTVGKRNIVMTLGLNPDWQEQTMSSLRHQLYRYLLPKAWTKLRFFSDDMPTVDIEGYVESFEPNIFSQDPEIQISVICPKPDFIEADAIVYNGLTDDGTNVLEFEYEGTVETGFEVRIDQTPANVSYIGPLEVHMQQEPSAAEIFIVSEITVNGTYYFKLSTIRNAKRVSKVAIADGAVTNLLQYMDDESVWPTIKPGTNLFSMVTSEVDQAWTLAFFNRFGGL